MATYKVREGFIYQADENVTLVAGKTIDLDAEVGDRDHRLEPVSAPSKKVADPATAAA